MRQWRRLAHGGEGLDGPDSAYIDAVSPCATMQLFYISAITPDMALILFIACVLVGSAAAGELQSTVAPLFKPAGEIIPGHYIVKLKDGFSLTASEALSEHASSAQNVYGNIFRGFATSLDEDQLAFLRLSPSVSRLFWPVAALADRVQTGRVH